MSASSGHTNRPSMKMLVRILGGSTGSQAPAGSSKTPVTMYQTIRRHIPEDVIFIITAVKNLIPRSAN